MSEKRHIRAKSYIDRLAAQGRYHFSVTEFSSDLSVSRAAAHSALSRLAKQGLIASPARGFYVVIPPEYRSLGCLPAEQFIPALFERKGEPYYAGLLTAAQYYGAAHQRPQSFQVMVGKSRKDIRCGQVIVNFIANKQIAHVPTRTFNTPRGVLKVSSPEATAFDLIGYTDRAGGLDMVATVLSDLVVELDPSELARLAELEPIAHVQRLGVLLELVDQVAASNSLQDLVERKARDYTPLAPDRPSRPSEKDARWKVYVNASVEVDE